MTAMVRFSPDLGKALKSSEVTLLGQVVEKQEEGQDLLHIVYRIEMEIDDTIIRSVAVSTMKRDEDGRYRFVLDEKAQGVITALQKRFGIK